MKRKILSLVLLLALTSFVGISYGQETRITGTLNMHPWVKLPVVISTDIQGGMQTVGPITLSASPAAELNTAIPSFTRNVGMVASVIDAGKNNQTRYFEYIGTDKWLEVLVIRQWETGHLYSAGESVIFDGNFYVANTGFTSADTFPKDSALWNSWGGKDAEFDVKALMLNGDTLTGVAVKNDVVPDEEKIHTLATVSYIDGASEGEVSYNSVDGSLYTYNGTAWVKVVAADNLGDHTAKQSLKMGSYSISNDGDGGDGVSFDTDGNSVFGKNVTVNGNFYTPSDERLKTHIETLTNVLVQIDHLRGVQFEYKDQTKYAKGPKIGVIAQELRTVYPDMVEKGADGFFKVDYSQLTAVLIQAVKEQQQQIKRQQLEMTVLKNKINDQQLQIDSIVKKLQQK